MELLLYQTLQDRGNPDEVEKFGPYPCRIKTAWLGEGYYFWDTHIQLGHWWGKTIYGDGYIICKAFAKMDETCWDLHGNGTHRLEFEKVCDEMVQRGLSTKAKLLVPHIFTFLRSYNKFPFKAIRALAMESMNYNLTDPFIVYKIKFKSDKKSYLDLRPPVQLCLITKTALSLTNYSVVFPDHYVDFDYI